MAAAALAGRASTLAPSAAIAARHSVPVSVAFAVVTNTASRAATRATMAPVAPSTTHATEQCSAPGTRESVRNSSLVNTRVRAFSFPAADADASSALASAAVTATRSRAGTAPSASRGGGGRAQRRDALGPSANATDQTLVSSPR